MNSTLEQFIEKFNDICNEYDLVVESWDVRDFVLVDGAGTVARLMWDYTNKEYVCIN